MSTLKNPDKNKVADLLVKRKANQKKRNPETLFAGILQGDTNALSESITLLESNAEKDINQAQILLQKCLPYSGKSLRIGITGVPGVGKSTFIESFGKYLTSLGKKVAVLAVDPSSEISKGSILGDKTRMSELSADPNAFIRPSASKGTLGGVANATRETILICEAAGYDIILVETVGVGQSEIAVHSMTDFFLLLLLPNAGDELQGIKKGIMEMADGVIIHKADGDLIKKANLANAQIKNVLHLQRMNESGWSPKVINVSSSEKTGHDKVWKMIQSYYDLTSPSGHFAYRRKKQNMHWLYDAIGEELNRTFFNDQIIIDELKKIESTSTNSDKTSRQTAIELITLFKNGKKKIQTKK